ncbi:hypothetical protein HZB07_01690 [Candidatus Saganbacteria bacterium]|nr:hypothetical protein [Candidatus Saganbacteria bacterium]
MIKKASGYFPHTPKQQILISSTKRSVNVEFFPAAFAADKAPWPQMVDDFVAVSRKHYAGKVKGDPPGYPSTRIEKYLSADPLKSVAVIFEDDQFRGFSITRSLTTQFGTAFYFVLTIIDPELQSNFLAIYLQAKQGLNYMLDNNLEDTLVVLDTPNPRVAGVMIRFLADPFPDPHQPNKPPTDFQRNFALAIVAELYPQANFDPDQFVLRDWYHDLSALLYRAEGVPRYRDPAVDAFFRQRLRVDQERGDKVIIIGSTSRVFVQTVVASFENQINQ